MENSVFNFFDVSMIIKGVFELLKKMMAFLLIFYLPNFILAGEPQALIEENFGERFYGVYKDEFKVGYLINKISQTDDQSQIFQ